MTWEEFSDGVKKTASAAADKINQSTDLASLQIKLSVAEYRLNEAYQELGKAAYRHFHEEQNTADRVANAMLLVDKRKGEVAAIKADIAKKREK